MKNAPQPASSGPISNQQLEALIEVGEAHEAGQPVSNPEAVFYLTATPALLRELLHHRYAQAGIEWLARPGNIVELAAYAAFNPVQPEGAA